MVLDKKSGFSNNSSGRYYHSGYPIMGWGHLSFNHLGNGPEGRSSVRNIFRFVYTALVAKLTLLQRSRMGFHGVIYGFWRSGFSQLVSGAPYKIIKLDNSHYLSMVGEHHRVLFFCLVRTMPSTQGDFISSTCLYININADFALKQTLFSERPDSLKILPFLSCPAQWDGVCHETGYSA